MTASRRVWTMVLLSIWAALLTSVTGVMGGIPLRTLRLLAGGWVYWMSLMTLALVFLAFKVVWLALVLLAVGMVIGLFSEFEERDHDLAAAATGAILITVLLAGGFAALWLGQNGGTWYADAVSLVEARLAAIPNWASQTGVEAKDIVHQLPSAAMIALSFALYLSLLFERRILQTLGLRSRSRQALSSFRSPEWMVWMFILGLGATFLSKDNQWLQATGVNLLNVSVVVYFFQGLAVVVRYFDAFRVGFFWRLVSLVFLVTQLFLVASSIGLADYWFDFRNRLASRTQQTDSSPNT